ncbi:fibronectin type III domain-containing protein [Marinobacter confluentis]|uniref:Fibronectin type III domain-containing protein n=1 Tax=Marinobacter confluentis TaxID=1697557 RepID=A0A4Z1CEI5_9GAMM|nr:fibronectin type III domain-containing protein [Marinobacter confluentis]TGN38310.1 fibronectin type III domain-containing protein [Marinobacter confluentis]
MTDSKPSHRARAFTALCLILAFALLAGGCKVSSGESSRADSADAAVVAENRLNGAVSSLQDTLGQTPRGTADRPTLRWEAPTTREDGSRLYQSDISEYRIYYRLRHQTAFQSISHPVSDGSAFPLDPFKPGAYEFSVTAVDSEGRESRRSDGVAVDLI